MLQLTIYCSMCSKRLPREFSTDNPKDLEPSRIKKAIESAGWIVHALPREPETEGQMKDFIRDAVWFFQHRLAIIRERWPLMFLSTHTAHVLALHERLKKLEKEVKALQSESWRSELVTENWKLRGDLRLYESAHRKATEAVREMKHVLTVHREEISWGTLDVDGTLKDRPVDNLTRTRFDELDRVVGLAGEFEQSHVPTTGDEEWPEEIA